MKKVTLTLLAMACGFFLLQETVEAQRVTAGGGVGYGSKSEALNFQVNLYYRLPTLPLRIGGDVGYSRPENSGGTKLEHIEGNVNLHLMVVDNELLSLYGLTGLNVLHSRLTSEAGGDTFKENSNDLGWNVGAGTELDIGNVGRIFGEAKYVIGSEREDQWVLGAGIRISLSN